MIEIFKDTYEIIKTLLQAAKKVKNQEVVQLAMDLQEKFFELRENNENLVNEIKELKDKLELLEKSQVIESDIEYSDKGFLTLKTDTYKIPYCSYCWKKEHKLYPLAQRGAWHQYHCACCKCDVVVTSKSGNQINKIKSEENK